MRVWPEKSKPKIQKPLLELLGQPRTCGKPPNKKCELLVIDQEPCSRVPEHTDRSSGEASPEIVPDAVHDGLNRGFEELRNLCTVCENVSVLVHQRDECEFTQSMLSSRP